MKKKTSLKLNIFIYTVCNLITVYIGINTYLIGRNILSFFSFGIVGLITYHIYFDAKKIYEIEGDEKNEVIKE